jgi:ABC-2 type transport system permease protein
MTTTADRPVAEVAQVRVAGGTRRDDARAVRMVWKREIVRYFRNRVRIMTSLAQPVLFLFVLGTGLSPIIRTGGAHVDFRTFMFPGVIAMTILFTAIFSAVSIVWDREFGFLREMLVAPVRRGALVVGKVAGGATVAALQGVIMLALAGLVHVPYSPSLLLVMVAEMLLTATVLTSVGVMIASRMSQVESFQVVMQVVVLPMFFLSGAVFPLSRLPRWLMVLTKIDPLSYAVDPLRRAVFAHTSLPAAVRRGLNPGMTWWGWRLPTLLELALVAAITLLTLAVAIYQFAKPE